MECKPGLQNSYRGLEGTIAASLWFLRSLFFKSSSHCATEMQVLASLPVPSLSLCQGRLPRTMFLALCPGLVRAG